MVYRLLFTFYFLFQRKVTKEKVKAKARAHAGVYELRERWCGMDAGTSKPKYAA